MKIAIVTVQVPFIRGGAENLTEMLRDELIKREHQADIITMPFKWYPKESLLKSMIMGRLLDLSEINGEKIDRVIALKFPAYYAKHANKVMWLLHQHRQAYDLWGTKYGDIQNWEDGEHIRDIIINCDNEYIPEAKLIAAIAENPAQRLKRYNGMDARVLYHPPKNHDKLRFDDIGDFIFYPSRIDAMKRQRVLVEAARYLKSNAKIYIAGLGSESELAHLNGLITKYSLQERVKLMGFISEEEKIDCYAKCLAVYFGAYDEDYGYITLESFFSGKPIIVHPDAGGPLEFVKHEKNGFVVEADPKAVANAIDRLYDDREEARRLGEAGYKLMKDLDINWDNVINSLLS